jgi:DNA-binding response OmpR family regulator
VDGFRLVQWLRAYQPGLPIILVTSLAGAAEASSELCENGPVMKKPYEHQLLSDRIRQLLAEVARSK